MRLAILYLAAALTSACGSPIEPSRVCGPSAVPGTVPPSVETVAAEIALGRERALATCPGVVSVISLPEIAWWQSPTWIKPAKGYPQGVCASGMTSEDGRTIFVSLADPSRLLTTAGGMGLITWEARNSYWIRGGCGEQSL